MEDQDHSGMLTEDEKRDTQGKIGFYVVPKYNCPHILEIDVMKSKSISSPCLSCSNIGENWICLTCSEIHCSRYVKGHMKLHNEQTKHPIAVSFADFSCWCYSCDAYIKHPKLIPLLSELHQEKFGSSDPSQTSFSNRVGAITDPEEIREFFDDPEVLKAKAKQFAQMVKESKYLVAYTGAGISTSANIPDYRGPKGVWTLKAQGKFFDSMVRLQDVKPTLGHMALSELCKKGFLKYVVTTNVDGLHFKSGIDEDHLAELHGSIYTEVCTVCGTFYRRDFDVTENAVQRLTGRTCEKIIPLSFLGSMVSKISSSTPLPCGGKLKDSIIHFGEDLPQTALKTSEKHSKLADLRLVLGTSMRVSPANQLPVLELTKNKKLIIVNLQKTPYDDFADLRVFAKTDEFLELVMKELNM